VSQNNLRTFVNTDSSRP